MHPRKRDMLISTCLAAVESKRAGMGREAELFLCQKKGGSKLVQHGSSPANVFRFSDVLMTTTYTYSCSVSLLTTAKAALLVLGFCRSQHNVELLYKEKAVVSLLNSGV
uniref:Uncharacterized protein n=1 Tax=Sphaerodactylus townsendi TaxID=933632 RepID=A0ACB8G733_9SAUR